MLKLLLVLILSALLLPLEARCVFFPATLHLVPAFLSSFIVYIGFRYSFFKGFIAVILITFILELMSFVPLSAMLVPHLIIFVSLQLLADQFLSESYLTQALWVFLFQIFLVWMEHVLVLTPWSFANDSVFWIRLVGVPLLTACLSIPLFIILDAVHGLWDEWFSITEARLTGVELYHAQRRKK